MDESIAHQAVGLRFTALVISHKARCVGGSGGTSLERLVFSLVVFVSSFYIDGVSLTHGGKLNCMCTYVTRKICDSVTHYLVS